MNSDDNLCKPIENMYSWTYTTWKNKAGRLIEIKEMSTDHIKNCITMMERSLAVLNLNDSSIANKACLEGTVFNLTFVQLHGKNYLDAFYRELETRNENSASVKPVEESSMKKFLSAVLNIVQVSTKN